MKRVWFLLLTAALLIAVFPLTAQDGNLLQDPGMEGSYVGRGRPDLNTSSAWGLTVFEAPRTQDWMNLVPVGFPHLGPGPSPHGGTKAQNFNRGYATFTLAMYQTVTTTPGTNLTASAWAQIKTCTITATGADNCASSGESGAYTRVGIDPNGGTNPYDSDVVWSANVAPHDTWLQMTTTATTTGGSATIFLFTSQNLPTQLNTVYFDDAYLGVGGAGGTAPGVTPAVPPTATPLPFVPFVVPQGERSDGSIIHIVGPGDTLDSIAFAYGTTRADLLALNPQIRDHRYIIAGQEITIRPPGSQPAPTEVAVVPETGNVQQTPQILPTAEQPPTVAPTPNRRLGVVGGSAGLSGYFPPRTVRRAALPAPPIADAGTQFENVALAGVSPAGVFKGTGARAKIDASAPKQEPPAPVQGSPTDQQFDPAVNMAQVCVLLFNDANHNRIQEFGEDAIPGAVITLSADTGDPQSITSDGSVSASCFQAAPGEYTVRAAAPDGYGMTTAVQFRVTAAAGAPVTIAFGAAQGFSAAPPPEDVAVSVENAPITTSGGSMIGDNLGIIVIGAAVVVLIAGMSVSLFLRKR